MRPNDRFRNYVESDDCKCNICKESIKNGVILTKCAYCGYSYHDEEISSGEPEFSVIIDEIFNMYRAEGWRFNKASKRGDDIEIYRIGTPILCGNILTLLVGKADKPFITIVHANDNDDEGVKLMVKEAKDNSFESALNLINDSIIRIKKEPDNIIIYEAEDEKIKQWCDSLNMQV